MKPGDHPQFFRFPAPEGRSRESTLRLDAEGHFFHEGERVEHSGLLAGLHSWIDRHPDDGRYILTNGYDWTYFTVEDAPFVVRSVRAEGAPPGGGPESLVLLLSDGTEEPWDLSVPAETRVGNGDALYTRVKRAKAHGPWEARFSRHAQTLLAPFLEQAGETRDETPGQAPSQAPGCVALRVGGALVPIGTPRS